MLKILSPRIHGVLDYAVVAVFLLAPTLLGLQGTAAKLAYVVAGIHLGLTLLTAFPMGAIKLIPFKVHGVIEVAALLGLAAAPWLFGFSENATPRNFYLVAAALIAGVVVLTNYNTTEAAHPRVGARHHGV